MNIPRLTAAALAVALSAALLSAPASAQKATPQNNAQTPAAKSAPATTAKSAKAKQSVTTTAASPCKGLAEAKCKTNAACTYVGASVRKTGQKVAAYCRLKSTKKK